MAGRMEDYGRRLLPIVVEDAAKHNPDRVAYSFPIEDDPSRGFHEITNSRYANGVNRTAWWIEEQFGAPEKDVFPSIGYIGPNDLRYAMLTLGAVKVGYKMMFLSPRNSIDGHLAVIDRCGCHLWVLPSQRIGRVEEVLANRRMTTKPFPELLDLLCVDPVPVYIYDKSFEDARQEPFCVLHTSGSTGLPKPIIVPNGSLATSDAHHLLPPIEGRLTQAQYFTTPHRAYSAFPMFHSAGMVWCFAFPFFYELAIVMGPAMVPVNIDLVNRMFDHANIDGCLVAPSTYEEISKSPASLARMAKLSFACFGGGPLSQECGNRINSVTRLFNTVGVTEGSLFPIVQAEREDWNYIHFHPAGGYTYVQRSDNLWEQYQTRNVKLELFQAFFQTFPALDEFAIKDLYAKHPTKPGRFLYKGRADDVVVLSNGEKLNPLDMEAIINDHSAVKACLVVGQGKFQTAALIQLVQSQPSEHYLREGLQDSIWKTIEEANRQAPAHGKIHRGHIMFAKAEKPFILAGKETVLRAMTTRLYQEEIDTFYTLQERKPSAEGTCFDVMDKDTMRKCILQYVTQLLERQTIDSDENIFVAGLDSLSVLKIVASLKATMRANDLDEKVIRPGLIYTRPTVTQLTHMLDRLMHGSFSDQIGGNEVEDANSLLRKYCADLPQRPSRGASEQPITVLLTGSTGSLGSYLLDSLFSNDEISATYCLNRSSDAQSRQVKMNKSRGLGADLSSSRVKFVTVDLSKPNFGLGPDMYHEILQRTTHIIHNQWQVDFNHTLPSFEPLIAGVRNLIDFTLDAPHNPKLFFISSIGVVSKQAHNEIVPESPLVDVGAADGGYGQSKLLSELLLVEANKRSGLRCAICRVGQIAGPVNIEGGMWSKQEWLPSIIASSRYLKVLPSSLSSLDSIDWLPVDILARIITELAGLTSDTANAAALNADEGFKAVSSSERDFEIFHTVNPTRCSWSALLPSVSLSLGETVKVVPWSIWLSALLDSQVSGDIDQNPALKLLDYYESVDERESTGLQLPILSTDLSRRRSSTLQGMSPVSGKWMDLWLKQWNFQVENEKVP